MWYNGYRYQKLRAKTPLQVTFAEAKWATLIGIYKRS